MEKAWFQEWFDTAYYHLLYQHRDETEAASFIDRLVEKLNPSDSAIMLDLACGKGRHAFHLALKGYDVTGLDLSFSSIEAARKMEHEKLHFYRHDMRKVFRTNYFDYVFNFFTSFGYFKNERENGLAISMMSQALKPDGTMVLDYLNPTTTIHNIQPEEIVDRGNISFEIRRWFDEDFFYKSIHVIDREQNTTTNFEEKVANISVEKFTKLFEQHGLKLKAVYGDYQFGNFEKESSPRMLMLAAK
jgi:SAM-dependent methyltransferase